MLVAMPGVMCCCVRCIMALYPRVSGFTSALLMLCCLGDAAGVAALGLCGDAVRDECVRGLAAMLIILILIMLQRALLLYAAISEHGVAGDFAFTGMVARRGLTATVPL